MADLFILGHRLEKLSRFEALPRDSAAGRPGLAAGCAAGQMARLAASAFPGDERGATSDSIMVRRSDFIVSVALQLAILAGERPFTNRRAN